MKVVIYSWFSTDRQNESSIADQERVCAEYAGRQGWRRRALLGRGHQRRRHGESSWVPTHA